MYVIRYEYLFILRLYIALLYNTCVYDFYICVIDRSTDIVFAIDSWMFHEEFRPNTFGLMTSPFCASQAIYILRCGTRVHT